MPIPFLISGLGAAITTGLGVGGHLSAKKTNEEAQKIAEEAKELYDNAKYSLEFLQLIAEDKITKLGYRKKNILDTSMRQFLNSYEKVQNVQFKEVTGLNEIANFSIKSQDILEIRQMIDIYSSAIDKGIIATLAINAPSLVASGASFTGSMLTVGGIGSLGVSITSLATMMAPAIICTAISANLKADENLEKANVMYAEAEAACEKMKISETLCNAIATRAEMYDDLLLELNSMFLECTSIMIEAITRKENMIYPRKLTTQDLSKNDERLIAVTRAIAGAIKEIINTPILSTNGNITMESQEISEKITLNLPGLRKKVNEVRMYRV